MQISQHIDMISDLFSLFSFTFVPSPQILKWAWGLEFYQHVSMSAETDN